MKQWSDFQAKFLIDTRRIDGQTTMSIGEASHGAGDTIFVNIRAVKHLTCIVLLVQRQENEHGALNRALLLARHFGARLELLLCETDRCSPRKGSNPLYSGKGPTDLLSEGEQYLRALRRTIVSTDVDIGIETIFAPTLSEGVAEKLRRMPSQLLIRGVRSTSATVGLAHGRLLERCQVPLLLTSGRPWRARPGFAAMVDLSESCDGGMASDVVRLSAAIAHRCDAHLDYMCANSSGQILDHDLTLRRLRSLGGDTDDRVALIQLRPVEAELALPALVKRRDYDMLVLGVPPKPTLGQGTLQTELLQAAAGDVLPVNQGFEAGGRGMEDAWALPHIRLSPTHSYDRANGGCSHIRDRGLNDPRWQLPTSSHRQADRWRPSASDVVCRPERASLSRARGLQRRACCDRCALPAEHERRATRPPMSPRCRACR